VDNHYVVGSGVGSKSRFVRSALRRRSSNNAQGKPCCSVMPKPSDNIVISASETPTCTNGMVWNECGSACPPTCENKTPICTKQCVAKCECRTGQYVDDGICIDANTCGFSETTHDTPSDVSCGALDGIYIKDSSGIQTKYCCTKIDGSGCISNGKDDVCYDNTHIDNSGNGKCLNDRFKKNICYGAQPPSPSHFTCADSPGSLPRFAFPEGNLTNDSRWKSNFPKASDLNINIDKRAAGTAFGPTSYSWIKDVSGAIDSIQLAKVWILATHGLKKTWQSGDIVHGGYPTCSQALSTAGMESGAAERPFNEYDAHFYGGNNGCRVIISGGCWQTSSAYIGWPNCTKYNLDNPFCAALQAWHHEAGTAGEGSCDSSGGGIASYCTKEQLQTQQGGRSGNGHNQGCVFGALCYGWLVGGWNSPLSGALFRLCGAEEAVAPNPWPSSTNPPASCNGWGKPGLEPKYNCEIAECACQKALKELQEDPEYSSLSFIENIDNKGYQSFIDACKAGPLS
jgi:hypothetical protein